MARTATAPKAGKAKVYPPEQVDRTPRLVDADTVLAMLSRIVDTAVEQESSTGSLGYHFLGKAGAPDGVRYQVDVRLTRIGTKKQQA